MAEFRKQYQNEPIDFHLWSQDKIAEFWWKLALEWVSEECEQLDDVCCLDCGCFSMVQDKIDEELEE